MRIHEHRYVYPPPNGPMSQGRCRCGDLREGANSLEAGHKFNNSSTRRPVLQVFVRRPSEPQVILTGREHGCSVGDGERDGRDKDSYRCR